MVDYKKKYLKYKKKYLMAKKLYGGEAETFNVSFLLKNQNDNVMKIGSFDNPLKLSIPKKNSSFSNFVNDLIGSIESEKLLEVIDNDKEIYDENDLSNLIMDMDNNELYLSSITFAGSNIENEGDVQNLMDGATLEMTFSTTIPNPNPNPNINTSIMKTILDYFNKKSILKRDRLYKFGKYKYNTKKKSEINVIVKKTLNVNKHQIEIENENEPKIIERYFAELDTRSQGLRFYMSEDKNIIYYFCDSHKRCDFLDDTLEILHGKQVIDQDE
tara:strand:+ start:1713 stop:2528 length:816 start_codon:yes stop_codon:yes gene_type:complete